MTHNDYWKIRAQRYNNLDWAKKPQLLQELIKFCVLEPDDVVLDAGCGTGIVAMAIKDMVLKVAAMDSSPDMLAQISFSERNIIPLCYDLQIPLPEFADSFNKVISRMVFHHLDDVDAGFKNCYNMLSEGGTFVIQEGIPPSEDPEVVAWYTKVMGMKETRNTITESMMRVYFNRHKFKNIETKIVTDNNFSVLNWLRSSGQDPYKLKAIYLAHKNAPDNIKKVYDMKDGEEADILMNTKVLYIKGRK